MPFFKQEKTDLFSGVSSTPHESPISLSDENIEKFEHQILSLEMELRYMSHQNLLSQKQLQRRNEVLLRLKKNLQQIQSRRPRFKKASEKISTLPSLSTLKKNELEVLYYYLGQKEKLMLVLLKDAEKVAGYLRNTFILHKRSFFTPFYLSKLRKIILKYDAFEESMKRDKASVDRYLEALCNKKHLPFSSTKKTNTEKNLYKRLQNMFQELQQYQSHLLNLYLSLEKLEEENNWMTRWLIEKEKSIQEYFPQFIPQFEE